MSASNGSPEDRISDLEGQNARLRDLLTEMTKERDAFKRMYEDEWLKNDVPPTPEELVAAVPHGPWYREFADRIGQGDPNAMDALPPGLRKR